VPATGPPRVPAAESAPALPADLPDPLARREQTIRRFLATSMSAVEIADEPFPAWPYHAVFTDSPFELVQAEGQHRDHAVVEQVFADVTGGLLAHMPSGVFAANAAWPSIAAMAHNLIRAAGALASLPFAKARAVTIRRDPDRCGRPHRPARPRPPHLAPARRLAPPARMADPARRGQRPARRSGLTSPDRSASRNGRHSHPNPRPRGQEPGQTAEQASGRTTAPGFTSENSSCRNRTGTGLPGIDRWIEAKGKSARS
jgi:hypothetical protein